jgi:hypothetical protein
VAENAVIMKQAEDESVHVLILYGVQQINCIRNKAGEIIEVFSYLFELNLTPS